MSEDITIERALIESLLGGGRSDEDDLRRWIVRPCKRAFPSVVWSVPGAGRFNQYGPWRMYINTDGNMGIGGFDNIITKLRDPTFREKHGLPPLDSE